MQVINFDKLHKTMELTGQINELYLKYSSIAPLYWLKPSGGEE